MKSIRYISALTGLMMSMLPLNARIKPPADPLARVPVYFEPNQGQFDSQVRFFVRGAKYPAWITDHEMILRLHNDVVRIRFAEGTPRAASGLDPLESHSNYFVGKDPAQWRRNVPNFAKAKLEEVYPGVDIVFYANGREVEYDFVLKPGADPSLISLDFKGPSKPVIDIHGNVSMRAGEGTLIHRAPVAFQTGKTLEASARLDRGRLGFRLGAFDRSQPVTIDPVLQYSTYLGGSLKDTMDGGLAVDAAGYAYIAGSTDGSTFPVTAGSADTSFNGGKDAFVTKIKPDGSGLVYSTFLGGSSFDYGIALAIDSLGQAYLAGNTESTDFPTTAGAFSTVAKTYQNVFVSKLDASGASLVYSTYLGGSSVEASHAIAVDASGNAYVAGLTASTDYPITPGAADSTLTQTQFGPYDAFVTKLNAAGTALVYSTFIGGSQTDEAYALALDSSGNAYVAGYSQSTDFPVTAGALKTTLTNQDGFVTKINAQGNAFLYSTYLGGSSTDAARGIAVDASGNAFLTGDTQSSNFPVTNGTSHLSSTDVFVAELNAAGNGIVFGTYLAGSSTDTAAQIALDAAGNSYISGSTYSSDFPTTAGAYDTSFNGSSGFSDAFMAEVGPTGTLLYGTFLGGSASYDFGTALAMNAGNVYVAGQTASNNFPVTAGAFDTTFNSFVGEWDIFVMKFSIGVADATPPVITPSVTPGPNANGWNNGPVNVSWTVTDADSPISNKTGCDPVTLNADTPLNGTTLTCTATSAGGTATKSVTIKIDMTAPAIGGSRTPLANANGWNNTNVDVNFTCSDALSGVVASAAAMTLANEGPGQSAGYTCYDLAGNSSSLTISGINIDKTAPVVVSQTASPNPAMINTPISIEALLTDAGTSGLSKAEYRMNGGAYSLLGAASGNSADVTGSAGSIPDASVAEFCVHSLDLAGNTSPEVCGLVAIYDPTGSFVTGGGSILSPAGALTAQPQATGRAQFAFQSKYLPGKNVPSGNTQFKFQEGNFQFDSTSYEWLVVAGARAQYKGEGQIQGVNGTFQFTLTAIDGKIPGGGGVDKFRLKVTGPGGVVYDNQMGASDAADPTTALDQGSIVIHKP